MSEKYDLSNREIATILCALRSHQKKIRTTHGYNAVLMSPWFDETTPLNEDEIDILCEKLNIVDHIATIVVKVNGKSRLDVFESIRGYVQILQQADPTIKITAREEIL